MTVTLTRQLTGFGSSVDRVLERIDVPAYLIDVEGRIRWLNPAARALVGDVEGHPFMDVVVPDDIERATEAFRAKIFGRRESTDIRIAVRGKDGASIPVEISSIAVHGSARRVVGVFGLAVGGRLPRPQPLRPAHLTPRQLQTLSLLGEGASTETIAERLGIAKETARNHIRSVLRELGVNSRLEAVVEAHARGLL